MTLCYPPCLLVLTAVTLDAPGAPLRILNLPGDLGGEQVEALRRRATGGSGGGFGGGG